MPKDDRLLSLLGWTEDDLPRFRGCWLSETGTKIVVRTRTGGLNRPYYETHDELYSGRCPNNDVLRKHPLYLYDLDDEYDRTYAHWYFAVPAERAEEEIDDA